MDISAPKSLCRLLRVTESRRLYRQAWDVGAGMKQPTGQVTLAAHFSPEAACLAPAQPPPMSMPIVHLTPEPEPWSQQLARIGALPSPRPGGAGWTTPCPPGVQSALS
jgi:hypothetical protein